MKKLYKLEVNLNEETGEAVNEIRKETGLSLTELIRRAISLYKFMYDKQRSGKDILVYDPKKDEYRQIYNQF